MNLVRNRSAEARLVERAKIVLACLDGKRNDEVARALGVRPNTVGLWRTRFVAKVWLGCAISAAILYVQGAGFGVIPVWIGSSLRSDRVYGVLSWHAIKNGSAD